MKVGALRHRVAVQRAAEGTADDYNQTALTWGTVRSVWASVKPLRGDELVYAQQVNAQVTHEVRMRWLEGLTPKDRLLLGTRVLNVRSVLNTEERNIEAVLLCSEET